MHACRLQVIPHRDGVPPTISCGPSAITLPVTHSPWPWNPCPFCPRCTKLLSLSHANAARSHMHCTCRAPLAAPHRGLSNISTRPILDSTPFTHPALLRRKHHGPILISSSLLCLCVLPPSPIPPGTNLYPHCPPQGCTATPPYCDSSETCAQSHAYTPCVCPFQLLRLQKHLPAPPAASPLQRVLSRCSFDHHRHGAGRTRFSVTSP